MSPTRFRLLAGIALVTGVLVWAVLQVLDARGGLPDIAWTTPATLALLAAAMLGTALAVRPRLQRKPGAKPMPPLAAARLAALALASSRVGAGIAGAYAGFVVALLPDLDTAYGRRRALLALLSVVASVALAGAALLLERACRVPGGPDDEQRERGLGSAA